jgi:hypothetical protein
MGLFGVNRISSSGVMPQRCRSRTGLNALTPGAGASTRSSASGSNSSTASLDSSACSGWNAASRSPADLTAYLRERYGPAAASEDGSQPPRTASAVLP